MSIPPEDRLRTLGIVAHVDAGKTTLTERILFETGVRKFQGSVDDGTAATDWLPEERQRGISIQSAAVRVPWEGCALQILDTPGHVDFGAEVARCFRVLDSVLVVLDGTRGVESQTMSVWRQAERWRCARIVFVNKLDRQTADFAQSVQSLRDRLGARPVVLCMPLSSRDGRLVAVGDVVRGVASGIEEPASQEDLARFQAEMQFAREILVEECAQLDDELLQAVLSEAAIDDELLLAAIARLTTRGSIVPVVGGSALTGAGVDLLLDAVISLLPSLKERNRDGLERWFPAPSTRAPLRALVFEAHHEETSATVAVRVMEGTLQGGMRLFVAGDPNGFVIDSISQPQAGNQAPMDTAPPGAIALFVGPKSLRIGDTLVADPGIAALPGCEFPPPVLSMLFEPADAAGIVDIQRALQKLQADDPTLLVRADRESGLPLVSGLGELHLEIVASRVRSMTGRDVACSRPRVSCQWRLNSGATGRASAHGGTGGEFHAAVEVQLVTVPGATGVAVEVATDLAAGLSAATRDALSRALAEAQAAEGEILGAGALVTHVQCSGGTLEDAVLAMALSDALAVAVRNSAWQRLEPKVRFTVYAPQESGSVVLADLHVRHATIREVSSGQLGARIEGDGMLRAFLGYAGRLRSITRGLGEAQLEHAGFAVAHAAEVPMAPQI